MKEEKAGLLDRFFKITPIRGIYILLIVAIMISSNIFYKNMKFTNLAVEMFKSILEFIGEMKDEANPINLNTILGLSTSVLGFTLTILSIFGIGISNATIIISNSNNMVNFLNDILDIITLSLASIITSIIIMNITYSHIIGIIMHLVFLLTIICLGIKFIKLSFVTFLMFGINLLSISEGDKNVTESKDMMLANQSKDIKGIKEALNRIEESIGEKSSAN